MHIHDAFSLIPFLLRVMAQGDVDEIEDATYWLILAYCFAWTFAAVGGVCSLLHRLFGFDNAPCRTKVHESASGPRVHVDSVSSGFSHLGGNAKGPINERVLFSRGHEDKVLTGVGGLTPLPLQEVEAYMNFRGGGPTATRPSSAEKRRRRQERLRRASEAVRPRVRMVRTGRPRG